MGRLESDPDGCHAGRRWGKRRENVSRLTASVTPRRGPCLMFGLKRGRNPQREAHTSLAVLFPAVKQGPERLAVG